MALVLSGNLASFLAVRGKIKKFRKM